MGYTLIAADRFAKRAMLDAIRDAYGIRRPSPRRDARGWDAPFFPAMFTEHRSAEHWHLCDEDGELVFCSREARNG